MKLILDSVKELKRFASRYEISVFPDIQSEAEENNGLIIYAKIYHFLGEDGKTYTRFVPVIGEKFENDFVANMAKRMTEKSLKENYNYWFKYFNYCEGREQCAAEEAENIKGKFIYVGNEFDVNFQSKQNNYGTHTIMRLLKSKNQ